ncbi:hypothetical protein GGF43_004929, partial [Coemansia sp. RSA 2618]
ELVRLFLACVDDGALAVVRDDGSVQLRIDDDVIDEHGARMAAGDSDSEVLYNPWPVLGSVLANNSFYEAKLLVLEWMLDHAANERMHVFERIGIDSLLPRLIVDSQSAAPDEESELQPSRDPRVRAAAIRLLAQLCMRLEIDARTLPVRDMLTYWDALAAQLAGGVFCPLPVATALVELQAALVHLLLQYPQPGDSAAVSEVNQRKFAWALQIYAWTDPERAGPYRMAVSRALVTYSAIKRYIEAGSSSRRQMLLPTTPVDAPSEEIMRLCYWRLLQDDDEEIREYMACSISRRLGRELACDQACEKLVFDFCPPRGSVYPRTYVRNRLRYIYAVDSSVAHVVSAAISPDCALFAHENPNIYIDEPRNVQLAYYSLVTLADIFAASEKEESIRDVAEMAREALLCVEALAEAQRVLIESRKLALSNGVVLNGVLGATSVSALFSLLQSWILGARLTVFAATKTAQMSLVDRVIEVSQVWAESRELQPLHPWIARSIQQLHETAARAKASSSMSKDEAVSDLFLLTYV